VGAVHICNLYSVTKGQQAIRAMTGGQGDPVPARAELTEPGQGGRVDAIQRRAVRRPPETGARARPETLRNEREHRAFEVSGGKLMDRRSRAPREVMRDRGAGTLVGS
jgi:hypothetical protein